MGFLIGLMVGGTVGFIVTALIVIGSEGDAK